MIITKKKEDTCVHSSMTMTRPDRKALWKKAMTLSLITMMALIGIISLEGRIYKFGLNDPMITSITEGLGNDPMLEIKVQTTVTRD